MVGWLVSLYPGNAQARRRAGAHAHRRAGAQAHRRAGTQARRYTGKQARRFFRVEHWIVSPVINSSFVFNYNIVPNIPFNNYPPEIYVITNKVIIAEWQIIQPQVYLNGFCYKSYTPWLLHVCLWWLKGVVTWRHCSNDWRQNCVLPNDDDDDT